MANNQAFCITYGGTSRNGNTYIPYTAIAHTADEAIAIINTWKTYGRKNSTQNIDKITVNERCAEKIRELFREGIKPEHQGQLILYGTMRTTNCGAWDISFYPALGDTLAEHSRKYQQMREAAKQERLRKAEEAKQRRLGELYEQKRGWYHVSVKIRLYVFATRGNDYMPHMDYSCDLIADSGMDAYDKTVEYIKNHPEELTHRGNTATLQSVCDPTSSGFEFVFLGVKTDEGYSVEKWEEWKRNGEI